ncbi:MAG TPA: glycosyltransferase family 9 protein [Pirellulales bacterium]|jgi:ADP-heptose:LPS heptosyltransferase/2-polyprenyl-3-methyl-5-hydroxy-6-metoxy-1,4-benzoquinol methylase|nr:glycosyltransferase family 9 protein [Pirellulales bacterium]
MTTQPIAVAEPAIHTNGAPRRLVLHSFQSPGDVLMLTAAVRDLHLAHPGKFQTDIRTSADALWLNNPHITPLAEHEAGVEKIECHYPLIHQANSRPYHFIHGYAHFLEQRLGTTIPLTRFAGDIHLSREEKERTRPFTELGVTESFWIVIAGGKYDFTAKWWNPANYQAVVDHFQGRLQFVQCGENGHWHPRLKGVVDLVGRTNLRDFVLLMHHAAGVLCPVTFAMHLAAAVEPRPGRPRRSCVVVAGAREPVHWEQYPGHHFLHTIGSLPCCASDPCWRSRCQLVGDGDEKDRKEMCERPIQVSSDLRIPECMELITPTDVIRAIERCLPRLPLPPGEGRGEGGLSYASPSLAVDEPDTVSPPPHASQPVNQLTGIAPRPGCPPCDRSTEPAILVDFRHGLGDAVQLTSVLAHLHHYHPDWQIDVAAGIGKLPPVSSWPSDPNSQAPYRRLLIRDRDRVNRFEYRHVFDLSWDECSTLYRDSPSTKAEQCLRSVFRLEPVTDLCRYTLSTSEGAWLAARTYLASICHTGTRADGRYPAVLLHYEGNTSSEQKNLPHELAQRVCEAAIDAGYVPVILDWDKRTPLADGLRIFNPGADAPLWGRIGTGDCETLAALIAQSSLFIGIDSGPLHIAGATVHGPCPSPTKESPENGEAGRTDSTRASPSPTPVIAVWSGHHPLHYFGLADHVTHLVPLHHSSLLRGPADDALALFESRYRHRVYRELPNELPALMVNMLTGEDFEQAANKEFLRRLSATGYDEKYYLEHKFAGLDYLGFGGWQQEYGRWLVESLDLKGKRLLDVGCACGSIMRGLGLAGAIVQGVDLCEAMIRRGREEWPDMAPLLNICDAVNLHRFADASWEAIHTAQVAEHWRPDLVPFIFRELARVTIPGGLMFCALDTEELFARQGRVMENEDPTHICIRPINWWHEQLTANGWQLCTADHEERLRAHPETFLTRYDWDWFIARRITTEA